MQSIPSSELAGNPHQAPRSDDSLGPFEGFPADVQHGNAWIGKRCGMQRPNPSGHRLRTFTTIVDRCEEGLHGAQLRGFEERQDVRNMNQSLPECTILNETQRGQREQRNMDETTGTPSRCLLTTDNLPADPTPILGRTETPRAQWRPTLEDIDSRMSIVLKSAFEGLAEAIRGPKSVKHLTLPKYEGSEWENPQEFLQLIRRTFEREQISREDWVTLVAEQLRGDAYRWYENFRPLGLDFETFEKRLLDRFDNMEIRSQLRARLFGQKQGKETASIFITKKLALYRRIFPEASEEEKICHIRTLLNPEIRMELRGSYVGTMDKLIQLAADVEMDLQEINHQAVIPVPNSSRNPAQRPSARPTPALNPAIAEGEARNLRTPPYPCRFCQGNHFHRDCHQRSQEPAPARRQLAIEAPLPSPRYNQGNSERAARAQEPSSQPGRRPNQM